MRRLPKILLCTVSVLIVLLALLLSGLRLALPHINHWRDSVLLHIASASGMPVDASHLQAAWRTSGPVLQVRDLHISLKDGGSLSVGRVNLALNIWQSLLHGRWQFQDLTFYRLNLQINTPLNLSQPAASPPAADRKLINLFFHQFERFRLLDSNISLLTHNQQRIYISIPQLSWLNSQQRHRAEGRIRLSAVYTPPDQPRYDLPDAERHDLQLRMDLQDSDGLPGNGSIWLHAPDMDLTPWLAHWQAQLPDNLTARLNLQAWLQLKHGSIASFNLHLNQGQINWQNNQHPHHLQISNLHARLTPIAIRQTSSDSATDEPTSSNLTTSNTTASHPATNDPTTNDPTTSDPTISNTTTNDPTTSDSTTSNLTTNDPANSDPTTNNTTTKNRTSNYPTTNDPATSHPASINPPNIPPIAHGWRLDIPQTHISLDNTRWPTSSISAAWLAAQKPSAPLPPSSDHQPENQHKDQAANLSANTSADLSANPSKKPPEKQPENPSAEQPNSPPPSAQWRLRISNLDLQQIGRITPLLENSLPQFTRLWQRLQPRGRLDLLALDIPQNDLRQSRLLVRLQHVSWHNIQQNHIQQNHRHDANRNSVNQENLNQNNASKESVNKNSASKKSISKNSVNEENLNQNNTSKESLNKQINPNPHKGNSKPALYAHWQTWLHALPAADSLTGEISGSLAQGKLTASIRHASISDAQLFAQTLTIRRATGAIYWQHNANGLTLHGDHIDLAAPSLRLHGDFRYQKLPDTQPWLSILAGIRLTDARDIWRYYPHKHMSQHLINYLTHAIQGGHADNATLIFNGNPRIFPFWNNEGVFRVLLPIRDARFQFNPHWPALSHFALNLDFVNDGLTMQTPALAIGSIQVRRLHAAIPHYHQEQLVISADLAGQAETLQPYFAQTPLRDSLAAALNQLQLTGDINARLQMRIPLDHHQLPDIRGQIQLNNNSLYLKPLDQRLEQLTGSFRFHNGELRGNGLRANWLNQPVQFDFTSRQHDHNWQIGVQLAANWQLAQLTAAIPRPLNKQLYGDIHWQSKLDIRLPHNGKPHYHLQLTSDLQHLGSRLPAPLHKQPASTRSLVLTASGDLQQFTLSGSLGSPGSSATFASPGKQTTAAAPTPQSGKKASTANAAASVISTTSAANTINTSSATSVTNTASADSASSATSVTNTASAANPPIRFNSRWLLQPALHLERAAVASNSDRLPPLPATASVDLSLPALNGDLWLALLHPASRNKSPSLLNRNVNLHTPLLNFAGQQWQQFSLHSQSITGGRTLQLQAKQLNARLIQRPNAPWLINISYLNYRPATATATASGADSKPNPLRISQLPDLQLRCKQCWLWGKNYGQISADLHADNDTLFLDNGVVDNGIAHLTLSGAWHQQPGNNQPGNNQPGNDQTHIKGTLQGKKLDELSQFLGMGTFIEDAPFHLRYQLSWRNTPWQFQRNSLNGQLQASLEPGKITEFNAGHAGQLLGLLSIDALLRRLRFDFRDQFTDGFYFDAISSDARIHNGVLRTDNTLIRGLAADIALQGDVDLVSNQLNLQATVAPEISTTVGVAAAFAVNPMIGAAVYAASKVLSPLWSKISLLRYQISGSPDKPNVSEILRQPAAAATQKDNKNSQK